MKSYGSSMTVFDLVFPNLTLGGDNKVVCPFCNKHNAEVNMSVNKFRCYDCKKHGDETEFTAMYYGISRNEVNEFKEVAFKSDDLEDYKEFNRFGYDFNTNFTYNELVKNYGVKKEILEEMLVGCEIKVMTPDATPVTADDTEDVDTPAVIETTGPNIVPDNESTRLVFPVILKGRVLDTRATTLALESPMTKFKENVVPGMPMPLHLWLDDFRPTIIVPTERDVAVLRSNGFNAISLGNVSAIPTTFIQLFAKRAVYIVYDNNNASRQASLKLASKLFNVTKQLYIADINLKLPVEDANVTQLFINGMGYKDLESILEQAITFDTVQYDAYLRTTYPEVSLIEASTTHLGQTVRSNIQVMATFEDQYSVPSYAEFKKYDRGSREENNRQLKNKMTFWTLQRENMEDILILTDNNLKQNQIQDNLKGLVGWGNEEYVSVKTLTPRTVFKASVSDTTESVIAKEIKRTEFVAYTSEKLEAGKNYQIIYKVVPHPYKGQQQVLIILEVKESTDVVTAFEVTNKVIEDLSKFQAMSFKDLVESQKAYVKFNVDSKLLMLIDLWYHTPKTFNFGYMEDIRGYLDMLIITESRVGKSTTAQALSKVYKLGQIASLAGSAATSAGLVGGSVKTGGSSQIRPGLIPRQHNRSIIFEELAKSKARLLPELTDIRSSGLVRINRSTGDLTLPASVRILFLTNPKAEEDGIMRPIIAYPNGLDIVKPIVGSIEDIARFDVIYILGDVPTTINPLWKPPKGFSEDELRTRIQWIWSRTTDQIVISPPVQQHIVDTAEALNKIYQSSNKIFSTETWKKLARLAIAIAGYMVSTDISYEIINVLPEHVDRAAKILESIYDNSIFKLKEVVSEERKTIDCTMEDVDRVKDLYIRFTNLIKYLERNNNIAKSTLLTVSGLDQAIFNEAIQKLSEGSYVSLTSSRIYPTPKLLIAIKKVREIVDGK